MENQELRRALDRSRAHEKMLHQHTQRLRAVAKTLSQADFSTLATPGGPRAVEAVEGGGADGSDAEAGDQDDGVTPADSHPLGPEGLEALRVELTEELRQQELDRAAADRGDPTSMDASFRISTPPPPQTADPRESLELEALRAEVQEKTSELDRLRETHQTQLEEREAEHRRELDEQRRSLSSQFQQQSAEEFSQLEAKLRMELAAASEALLAERKQHSDTLEALDAVRREVRGLEDALVEQRLKTEALKDTEAESRRELESGWREKVAAQTREIQTLRDELSSIPELAEQLSTAERALEQQSRELEEGSEALRRSASEVAGLKSELGDLEREKRELQTELDRLRKESQEASQKWSSERRLMEEGFASRFAELLETQKQKLEDMKEAHEEREASLRTEADRASEEMRRLRQEQEGNIRELQKAHTQQLEALQHSDNAGYLQELRKQSDNHVRALEEKDALHEQRLQELRSSHTASMEQLRTRHVQELDQRTADWTELRRRLEAEASQARSALSQTEQGTASTIQSLQAELDRLRNSHVEKIQELESRHAQDASKVDLLQQQLKELRSREPSGEPPHGETDSALRQELKRVRELWEESQRTAEEARSSHSVLVEKLARAQREVSEKDTELKLLQRELDRSAEQHSRLRAELKRKALEEEQQTSLGGPSERAEVQRPPAMPEQLEKLSESAAVAAEEEKTQLLVSKDQEAARTIQQLQRELLGVREELRTLQQRHRSQGDLDAARAAAAAVAHRTELQTLQDQLQRQAETLRTALQQGREQSQELHSVRSRLQSQRTLIQSLRKKLKQASKQQAQPLVAVLPHPPVPSSASPTTISPSVQLPPQQPPRTLEMPPPPQMSHPEDTSPSHQIKTKLESPDVKVERYRPRGGISSALQDLLQILAMMALATVVFSLLLEMGEEPAAWRRIVYDPL